MPFVERTQLADEDLREIAYYIGVESGRPAVADRVIDGLLDCCEQRAALSTTSRQGTSVPELGRDLRLYRFQRWVVIFKYVDDGVLILRFADGSQDFMSWTFS